MIAFQEKGDKMMENENIGDLANGIFFTGEVERIKKARAKKGISSACRNGAHEHCFERWCRCGCHVDDFY